VQIVKSLSKVTTELFDSVFRQLLVLFNQLKQISTSTVLKNNPKMVSGLVPVEELKDVPVFEVVENPDFVQYFLSPILLN